MLCVCVFGDGDCTAGAAFNNLMWASDDTEVVEFNEYPDDPTIDSSFAHTPVRRVFALAAWARGLKRFWVVRPSLIDKLDFYAGPMRVPVGELLLVLKRIGVLRAGRGTEQALSRYPSERLGVFNVSDRAAKYAAPAPPPIDPTEPQYRSWAEKVRGIGKWRWMRGVVNRGGLSSIQQIRGDGRLLS